MGCLQLTYREEESSPLKVSWNRNTAENVSKGVENFGYNKLTITFHDYNNEQTLMSITSTSRFIPTIIFDCGESFIRLVQLEKALGLKKDCLKD